MIYGKDLSQVRTATGRLVMATLRATWPSASCA
jgi:hypothetical protein